MTRTELFYITQLPTSSQTTCEMAD
ncbi:unnamed protein product, partial [Allacma fusca]